MFANARRHGLASRPETRSVRDTVAPVIPWHGGGHGGAGRRVRCDPRLHEHAQRVVGRDLVELEYPGALVGVRVRVRARDPAELKCPGPL